jgi:hypothetical protein
MCPAFSVRSHGFVGYHGAVDFNAVLRDHIGGKEHSRQCRSSHDRSSAGNSALESLLRFRFSSMRAMPLSNIG